MAGIFFNPRRPMKGKTELIPLAADPDNLRLAFWKAARGKRHTAAVLAYQKQLGKNLLDLRAQMLDGKVRVGQYRFFKVYEPKERQICAPAFREQVLHHALMNICHPDFERAQIFDSYASRIGKGVHAALDRAKIYNRRFDWYLKLDVRKFFDSIRHEVLKRQLTLLFNDARLLDVFAQIIDHCKIFSGRGLPIGNLTSQYFANHYLCGLDHFIKEELQIVGYVRYMDDMVLWHKDKAALKTSFSAIRDYIEIRLLCALKPHALNRCASGLPFLGYHLFPNHVRLTQQSKKRFIRKFTLLDEHYTDGSWSEAKCQRHALPLIDFTKYADAAPLRLKLLTHYFDAP